MAKTIRIDLTEELGAGQYIEMRDPRLLPWGVQRELASVIKDNSIDSQLDALEQMVLKLVVNLNVFDEDGNPIMLPLTKESVARMPAPAVEAVALKFTEARMKGADVPKK